MKRFTALYEAIDRTTSTNAKVDALAAYFAAAPAADAAWALYLLTGRRIKRLLPTRVLVEWTMADSGISEGRLQGRDDAGGDLPEIVARLLGGASHRAAPDLPLHRWIEERLLPLRGLDPAEQHRRVHAFGRELPRRQLYVLAKIITGEFRVGVSHTLVVRAL